MPENRLRRCFCEIDPELLTALARRRYTEGCSTLELVRSAESAEAKEAASCVALLDLPEDLLVRALGREGEGAAHARGCRRKVLARLRAAGVEIR